MLTCEGKPIGVVDLALTFVAVMLQVERRTAHQTPVTESLANISAAPTKGKGIRKTRHVGIGTAAVKLGVTRNHLWRVIRGERCSPRIEAWLKKNMRRAG